MFSAAAAAAASVASAKKHEEEIAKKQQQLKSLDNMRQKISGELEELNTCTDEEDHIT